MQAGFCPNSGYGCSRHINRAFPRHDSLVSIYRYLDWFGHGKICPIHLREFQLRVSWTWNILGTSYVVHNHRSNQSALMIRCGTDSHHQYGVFCAESQTFFSRNATRAGSEQGTLFSQAIEFQTSNKLFIKNKFQLPCCHPVFKIVFITGNLWSPPSLPPPPPPPLETSPWVDSHYIFLHIGHVEAVDS